jgi:citrate lyase beta subunit
MLSRLGDLPADAIALDLEDGVAPDDKAAARENLRVVAAAGRLAGERLWMVRINATGAPWHDDDLALVEELAPPAVLVPKAEDPGMVRDLALRFARHDSDTALMIETAIGLGRTRELAGAHPRVGMLVYGNADLRLSLGARPDDARVWERHALHEILLGARMSDCLAIDAVHFHFKDLQALAAHARIARDLGYDGKSCIHPLQTRVIHEVFASSPEEVRWAGAVLDQWEKQDGDAKGVIVVDGEMIEALHVTVARRILARR